MKTKTTFDPILTAREKRELQGEVFRNIEMVGVDLSNADLRGVRFERVVLRGCNLAGADLRGAHFVLCDLRDVVLDDAKLGDQITRTLPNGQSRTVTRAGPVMGHIIDMADHYSQLANYMRLNNMLPPTALPRPRPPGGD